MIYSIMPYLRILFLLLFISGVATKLCLAAPASKSGQPKPNAKPSGLVLAHAGYARMPIVISPGATARTQAVADELAVYLKRITGAVFEVRVGAGTSGIVLGTLAEFPQPALSKPLEIRNGYDGKEAYSIRTEPKRLLLIGATELGASHAAFRFLELLGCRWFFPSKEWEVVPAASTLRFNASETDRPAILARRIWWGWGFFQDTGHPLKSGAQQDYQDWSRHNRMASSLVVNAGHAWEDIISQFKAQFDQHPEYYALVKGERKGPQLCVSHAVVRRMAVAYALNYFEKKPDADMVSMEPSDGSDQCECENCKRLGSLSDRVFGLANEVAKAVVQKYPGKMVGLYAYHEHCEPPSFPLEPNVYVQLTAGFITGRYSFDELLEIWPTRSKNMGFYEYFSVWAWDQDRLPGGRVANVTDVQQRIRRYHAKQATSLDAESGNNWGPHGRGYYIANKLMWNPRADIKVLLADFYDKAFGPGAAAMQRYYERLDPGSKPLMSKHLLGLAWRDVDEASRLAANRPDVLARLDHIKQYLRYIRLTWMLDRETDKARQKELNLAILTHAYRTRYSYMNHWEAIRQNWTAKAAKDFNEPAWAFNDATPGKAWAVEIPYTHEETEKIFQEGLEYFQPQRITEKTFSSDLVPVRFAGSPTAISRQHYQRGLRYALYSIKGEPLKIEIVPGTIAWYRNRADARYVLYTAAEKKISEGRLKLDGEKHNLELKVPAPGLYYFDFNDSDAGWIIALDQKQPGVIPLQRDHGFMHQGHMQEMYFYVPKGTRQIEYYWSGGPHRVLGPDKQAVQEVKTSGEFVTIPVPPGMDGKPWSFNQLALGHLWFFNLPNYLAASPDALLLPREVAVEDKLDIRR